MKENLLELIDKTDEIEKLFSPTKINGNSSIETIYTNQDFLYWKQALIYELTEILERINDTYIKKTLEVLQQRMTGWDDKHVFAEIK